MTELLSHPAAAPLANLFILAGLALIIFAIFARDLGATEPEPRIRIACLFAGALVLFYVYGICARHAPGDQRAASAPESVSALARAAESAPPPGQSQPELLRTFIRTVSQTVFPGSGFPRSPMPSQQPMPPAEQPVRPLPNEVVQPALQRDAKAVAPSEEPGPSSPLPVQHPAAQALFTGKWKNSTPGSRGVVFLKVEQEGTSVAVRAWGVCASQYCDWGTGQGSVTETGTAVSVAWNQGEVLRTMKLYPQAEGLRMVLDSAYRDRRASEHLEERFARTQ